YSEEARAAFERAASSVGRRAAVHVKVDTGMHRVGLAPEAVLDFVGTVSASPDLTLEEFCTHLAVADGDRTEDREFTELQIDAFERHLGDLAARGIRPPLRHAANSAGAIPYPSARFDF